MPGKTIISLTGNMGVGKDTMADYLASRYGFVKISMADPFKRMAKEIFNFSDKACANSALFIET